MGHTWKLLRLSKYPRGHAGTQAEAPAGRMLDPVPVAEILLAVPERPQGRMDAVDIGRRITEDGSPEGSQSRRVSAVNGHLDIP
jgi:hypothetical protein